MAARKAEEVTTGAAEGYAPPVPGEFNPEVNNLLHFAKSLAEDKAALFTRIDANRQILRNYKTTGLLSDEQAAAVDEFYPLPKRTAKGATAEDADANANADSNAAGEPAAA